MPNQYTRKRNVPERGSWSAEDLWSAINAVVFGEMGVNEAAKAFHIPKTTFKRRLAASNLNKTDCLGPGSLLGREAEAKLATHIQKLQKRGFAPTRQKARIMTYNLAERLGIQHKFNREDEHIRDAVFTDGNSAFALLIGTLRTFQRAGCDNEVVTLRCPPGTSIAIQVAQYGKSTSTEGPCAKMMSTKSSLFPEIYDKKVCLLPSSIQTVIEACQKKRMCKFQTSPITFGGDPCPGIPKYVEVAYKCKPYEFRSKTVCENERIQLKCNPNQRVAIYSASYGRTQYESVQCPQAPGVPEETCLASYATETAMQLCHGKRRCEMAADIGTFGSPCRPQSRTYLKLVYTCVPRIVLKDTYDGPPEPDELDYNPHEYLDFENFENYDNENEHMGESAASPGSKADSKEVLHENATEEDDPTTELPNVFWFEIHQLHIIYAGIGITIITFLMVSALVIRYLYKRHQRTKDNSNSYAASGSENTLPHGFTDEISEVDADIDLQTTLPLSIPSVTIHRPLPPCLPNIGPSISDAVRFAEYPEFPRLPSHTRTFRGSASGILETEVVATRPIMCDASTSHTSQYYYG